MLSLMRNQVLWLCLLDVLLPEFGSVGLRRVSGSRLTLPDCTGFGDHASSGPFNNQWGAALGLYQRLILAGERMGTSYVDLRSH